MSVTVYYGNLKPREGSVVKNSSISLFRQILDLVPKHEFEKIIMKHNGNKHKQTFDCWAHFVSIIFCQLAQGIRIDYALAA